MRSIRNREEKDNDEKDNKFAKFETAKDGEWRLDYADDKDYPWSLFVVVDYWDDLTQDLVDKIMSLKESLNEDAQKTVYDFNYDRQQWGTWVKIDTNEGTLKGDVKLSTYVDKFEDLGDAIKQVLCDKYGYDVKYKKKVLTDEQVSNSSINFSKNESLKESRLDYWLIETSKGIYKVNGKIALFDTQADADDFIDNNELKDATVMFADEDDIKSGYKMNESLKESKDVVDTLYDVNTLDYENDKLYKKNVEHYDTYSDYDEALETYKELSHESFYPHVELCKVTVDEDGHREYEVLKATYLDSGEMLESTNNNSKDKIKIKSNNKIEINKKETDDDKEHLGNPIQKGLKGRTLKVESVEDDEPWDELKIG